MFKTKLTATRRKLVICSLSSPHPHILTPSYCKAEWSGVATSTLVGSEASSRTTGLKIWDFPGQHWELLSRYSCFEMTVAIVSVGKGPGKDWLCKRPFRRERSGSSPERCDKWFLQGCAPSSSLGLTSIYEKKPLSVWNRNGNLQFWFWPSHAEKLSAKAVKENSSWDDYNFKLDRNKIKKWDFLKLWVSIQLLLPCTIFVLMKY